MIRDEWNGMMKRYQYINKLLTKANPNSFYFEVIFCIFWFWEFCYAEGVNDLAKTIEWWKLIDEEFRHVREELKRRRRGGGEEEEGERRREEKRREEKKRVCMRKGRKEEEVEMMDGWMDG